ncbi:MAG: chemotaxis protein CheB [Candidatus Latescibacterota bacterium]
MRHAAGEAGGGAHGTPPVDALFQSLARELGRRATAVGLSGTGGDGTLGVRAVRTAGGVAIAQAPDTAEHPSMPQSAIATGLVDALLPVERMAACIQDRAVRTDDNPPPEFSPHEPMDTGHLDAILDQILTRTRAHFRT